YVFNLYFFFFFQAEDGIRDFHVTGVQTCALPISKINSDLESDHKNFLDNIKDVRKIKDNISEKLKKVTLTFYLNKERKILTSKRSEERRVGKECRSRWSPYT